MSVDLTSEVWIELKRYINTVDRADAAEALISILVENNVDADEIRQAFKGDSDVKRALVEYLRDGHQDEEDVDEEEEYDDHDYNEDDDEY
jgi:hypothetical protein